LLTRAALQEADLVAHLALVVVELQRAADPCVRHRELIDLHRAMHQHDLDLAAVQLQVIHEIVDAHTRRPIAPQVDLRRAAAGFGRPGRHAELARVTAHGGPARRDGGRRRARGPGQQRDRDGSGAQHDDADYFSRPSAFIAACTDGRAAMRA
jgi:hypothetical protein